MTWMHLEIHMCIRSSYPHCCLKLWNHKKISQCLSSFSFIFHHVHPCFSLNIDACHRVSSTTKPGVHWDSRTTSGASVRSQYFTKRTVDLNAQDQGIWTNQNGGRMEIHEIGGFMNPMGYKQPYGVYADFCGRYPISRPLNIGKMMINRESLGQPIFKQPHLASTMSESHWIYNWTQIIPLSDWNWLLENRFHVWPVLLSSFGSTGTPPLRNSLADHLQRHCWCCNKLLARADIDRV